MGIKSVICFLDIIFVSYIIRAYGVKMNIHKEIKKLPVASFLSNEELEILASVSSLEEFDAGLILFDPQTPFEYVGFILKGKVSIYIEDKARNKMLRFTTVSRGPFGAFNLDLPEKSGIHMKTDEDSLLYLLPLKELYKLENEHPGIAMEIYKSHTIHQSRALQTIIKKFM